MTAQPIQQIPGQGDLFDGPGQARHTDPATAKLAASLVKAKATSARVLLLHAFLDFSYKAQDPTDGLTDEEAAVRAGLNLASEYATRCSELRRAGLLAPTGETRQGSAGPERIVSTITAAGRAVLVARRAS